MRLSTWILGVGLGLLLAVLSGCGGSSTPSGKTSSPSERKTDHDMPTPPKSDPG
jgi:hypothetical protein